MCIQIESAYSVGSRCVEVTVWDRSSPKTNDGELLTFAVRTETVSDRGDLTFRVTFECGEDEMLRRVNLAVERVLKAAICRDNKGID